MMQQDATPSAAAYGAQIAALGDTAELQRGP